MAKKVKQYAEVCTISNGYLVRVIEKTYYFWLFWKTTDIRFLPNPKITSSNYTWTDSYAIYNYCRFEQKSDAELTAEKFNIINEEIAGLLT